jgi:endonuclease/exonuclease/phosphatase family metal-dependent hydrolase
LRLIDKATGTEFRITNLHLNHINQGAREKQIEVVLTDAAQYQPDMIQILKGDFNVSGINTVYNSVLSYGWIDTYTAVHGNGEPGFTAHAFKGLNVDKKDEKRLISFLQKVP